MTREEEAATVTILTSETVNPDGSIHDPVNVRFSEFGEVSSEEIAGAVRWLSAERRLEGDALTDALISEFAKGDWDPLGVNKETWRNRGTIVTAAGTATCLAPAFGTATCALATRRPWGA